MGLDMYLKQDIYIGANWHHIPDDEMLNLTLEKTDVFKEKVFNIPKGKISTITLEVGYWRKANQIHMWFVNNCGDGEDDCQEICVDAEKLEKLKRLCKLVLDNHDLADELLPTAKMFSFGGTDYDEYYFKQLEDTVEIIDKLDPEEVEFIYQASW